MRVAGRNLVFFLILRAMAFEVYSSDRVIKRNSDRLQELEYRH